MMDSGSRKRGICVRIMPPALRILIEHHAVIAERRQVARDRERGGAAAHQRDALAVLDGRRLGQPVADIVLVVGGDALQAADRDRLFLDAAAPAGRLARPVAGAPEDSGKHVRLPIDHVGVAVAACGDQPDVFGDGRVCRTGPLTIHDLVEVVRRRNVGGFHLLLCTHACCALLENHARTSVGRSFLRGPACGPPNPARILVERPPEIPPIHSVITGVLQRAALLALHRGHSAAIRRRKSSVTAACCHLSH